MNHAAFFFDLKNSPRDPFLVSKVTCLFNSGCVTDISKIRLFYPEDIILSKVQAN